MKLVKLLPLSILALSLSLASCNNEVRETPQAGETTLELSSSIGHTRVTTQSDNSNHWDGNENIGVYSSSLSASNVLYTAKTAGASTDFTTSTPITIPMGATKHEIKAYYPYDAAANTSVTIDLTKGNVQPLLYATGEVTNATPKLNLNFAHKLGKLRIKVDVTNSLTPSAAVDKVSVAQALTKGTLTIDNGNFTVDQATKADLTLKAQNGEFYTYLMPGETIKDKVITIQHGSKLYKATLTSTKTVEAGKYYLYTITLSNGSAKVEEGTGTIAGESEGETGTVEGAPEGEATPVTPTTVTATLNSSNSAFSNNQLTAPAAGGDFTFTLSGLEAGVAVSATANPTADWITFEGDVTLRAAVDKTFTIKVKANETTEARETTITLKAEGMNDLTFKISQAKKETSTPIAGEVALFKENNIENNFNALKANFASIAPTSGKNGGQAILLNGTQSGNNSVFELTVPADFNNKPKSISFYIKGEASGSLVFRPYGTLGQLIDSGKGFVVETTSGNPILTFAQNNYSKAINTQGEWTKMTLDITNFPEGTELNNVAGSVLFEVRVGKGAKYNILISDFTVEY